MTDLTRIRPGLIVEQIDDECLVLDMERDVYFGLNPLGLMVWRAVERGEDVEAIVEAVCARYEKVPADTIRADVMAFIEDAIEQGLFEVSG